MKAVFDLKYEVMGFEPCSWSVNVAGICGLWVDTSLKRER